ncbi:hypothetical protein [Streptomyces sp. CB01373]|nr:hypothetical protein [Streptomyces sp. CB01373]
MDRGPTACPQDKKAARAVQDPRTFDLSAALTRCGRLPPLLVSYEQR